MMQSELQGVLMPDKSCRQKSGCYVKNAYVLEQLDHPRVMVPLKHIEYQVEIGNSLAYHNPTDKYLEVEYAFPVNPSASVYKFSAAFGDVLIEGRVEEKEQARQEYESAKMQGKQVAMGTLDPQSKDIMHLQLGNIPPHTHFTLTISFMQELSISLNTFYKLHLPSSISPRYTDSIHHLLKQQHQQQKKPSKKVTGKGFTWTFKVDIKSAKQLLFFQSPSHDISLISQNQAKTETILAMAEASLPDKDFSFLFTTESFHLPSYVMGKTDVGSMVMLSLIPKFCILGIDDAYKAEIQGRSYEPDMTAAKGDYVFLLDRSGSMKGTRIEKAKEALTLFLKSLPEDSFFNVISFGSSREKVFASSQRYTKDTLKEAINQISLMGANLGKTIIYEPLRDILEEKPNEGYPKHVFLLTDGAVSNTEGVLKLIKAKVSFCRVHCIGIGNGASLSLIEGGAKNGKGKYVMISDTEKPSEKIIGLLESALTPLITSFDLKYDEKMIQSIVPNPKTLPFILKDELVNFYVNFKVPLDEAAEFIFEYKDSVSNLPYKTEIKVSSKTFNEPFVNKMGHLKVVKALEEASEDGINLDDRMMHGQIHDYKQAAIKELVKHQVLSSYTAFLCIGKHLVDGQFQEYVDKGLQRIHIQQPKPVEWHNSQMLTPLEKNKNRLQELRNKRIQKNERPKVSHFRSKKLEEVKGERMMGMQKQEETRRESKRKRQKEEEQKMKMLQEKKKVEKQMRMIEQIEQRKRETEKRREKEELQKETIKEENLKNQHQIIIKQNQESSSFEIKESKQSKQNLFQQKSENDSITHEEKQYSDDFEFNKREKSKPELRNPQIIHKIVYTQNIDGSWSDCSFIKDILVQKNLEQLGEKIKRQILLTYLAVIYIQKYHPQKQYILQVRKAQTWLKKAYKQNNLEEEDLKHLNMLL